MSYPPSLSLTWPSCLHRKDSRAVIVLGTQVIAVLDWKQVEQIHRFWPHGRMNDGTSCVEIVFKSRSLWWLVDQDDRTACGPFDDGDDGRGCLIELPRDVNMDDVWNCLHASWDEYRDRETTP